MDTISKLEYISDVDRDGNCYGMIPPSLHSMVDRINSLIDRVNELENGQRTRQHVYIFKDDEDGDLIADIWTCSVPNVGERIIIWSGNAHHHYKVSNRIYGVNVDAMVGVWNLYVRPYIKED